MAGSDSFLRGVDDRRNWCMISYLPLAHIYEVGPCNCIIDIADNLIISLRCQRISELDIMKLGGTIGYSSGDPLRLLEDIQILKPSFFPTVPRVLNRVYQAAMSTGQTPTIKGYLFRTALDAKIKNLHKTGEVTHAFWDKLVFKKVTSITSCNLFLV